MRDLPTGTVTFLFTDIEGSTKLLHELGDDYADALAEHRRVLREAFARHGGVEVDTQGDAFFYAFARAKDGLAAADEGQQTLADGPIRVRMGLHTGEPVVGDEGYVGIDVHRAARIAAAGHGGQVLVSQSTRDLVDAGGLRDLGEHRLKDLTAPVRLFQLGEGDFPPLKSLHQTNLPVQPTALVGRETELAEILELVRSHRLVTLTGAGGSGKTRLGLQVAAELIDDFADGVFWTPLAAITDPSLVVPTVASAVGAGDDLGAFTGQKRVLILLDNLEQIVDCGNELAKLLGRCPNLAIMATSRAPLQLAGEQQYDVRPLPIDDASELFEQRAQNVTPSFVRDENVAEICRRLDGLPLAVELAAARVKLLTTKQILDRLGRSVDVLAGGARDLPLRQQTLRATIEWSYKLLDEAEKQLFARLAVFAGSFDLDGAEAICSATLETLEGLVDKSLLRRTENGRFFMLETIAEYARELLARSDDVGTIRERHRSFFLAMAEAEEKRVRGPDAREALNRLEADHANLQSAIRTALEDDAGEIGLRIASALHPFWYLRGHLSVGRLLCDETLAAAPLASTGLRVKGLRGAAEFALLHGDLARGRSLLEERLALCERGESDHLASTLTLLGHLAFFEGKLELTERLYAQALAREREVPGADPWLDRATALSNLGWAQLCRRRFDEAERTLDEGLAVASAVGDDIARARLQNNLARVALGRNDDRQARQLALASLDLLQTLRDEQALAECFDILACVAGRSGAAEVAATLAGARNALHEHLGILAEAEAVLDDGLLAALTSELGETWTAACARGESMSIDEAIEYGLAANRIPAV